MSASQTQISIGQVRQLYYSGEDITDVSLGRPIRILMVDDQEVFYDVWWEHTQNWGMAKKGRCIYYRVSLAFAQANTVFLRNDPLSESEIAWHQPDLPMRVGCTNSWLWSNRGYDTLSEFRTALIESYGAMLEGFEEQIVNTPKVTLIPIGPSGGFKTSATVEALNGVSFSQLELLWHAHLAQKKYVSTHRDGVGIYRSGIDRRLPSYYLAGPISLLEAEELD